MASLGLLSDDLSTTPHTTRVEINVTRRVTGKTVAMQVEATDTIATVIELYEEAEGTPRELQSLWWRDMQLNPEFQLCHHPELGKKNRRSYDICSGATLYLVVSDKPDQGNYFTVLKASEAARAREEEEEAALAEPPAKRQRPEPTTTTDFVALKWNLSDEEKFFFELSMNCLLYDSNVDAITRLFNCLDRDDDGVLTAEDFQEERFKKLGEQLAAIWKQMHLTFDVDGDGEISEQEFVAGFVMLMLKRRFTPLQSASGLRQLVSWVRELNRHVTETTKAESEKLGIVTLSRTLTTESTDPESGPVLHRLTSIEADRELTSREKFALRPIRALLNAAQGQQRDQLFNALDADKDGVLNALDFEHKMPNVQMQLQALWTEVKVVCDRDKDQVVTVDEFEAGIIWEATRSQFGDATAQDGLGLIKEWGYSFMQHIDVRLNGMMKTLASI